MGKFLKTVLLVIRNGIKELYDIFAAFCVFIGVLILMGVMGHIGFIEEPHGTYVIICIESCEMKPESGQKPQEKEKPRLPAQRT